MNYIPSEPKQAYIYILVRHIYVCMWSFNHIYMYVVIDIFSYSYFHRFFLATLLPE